MGRVRTKTVKKAAKVIVEKYYGMLTTDFQTNKKLAEEVAIIPSKRLRNKIAGYTTHLMKRIQKGTVKGISLKLQEEERERRLDFVPEVSWVDEEIQKEIKIDDDVASMLQAIGFKELNGVKLVSKEGFQAQKKKGRSSKRGKGPRKGDKKKPETQPAPEAAQ